MLHDPVRIALVARDIGDFSAIVPVSTGPASPIERVIQIA